MTTASVNKTSVEQLKDRYCCNCGRTGHQYHDCTAKMLDEFTYDKWKDQAKSDGKLKENQTSVEDNTGISFVDRMSGLPLEHGLRAKNYLAMRGRNSHIKEMEDQYYAEMDLIYKRANSKRFSRPELRNREVPSQKLLSREFKEEQHDSRSIQAWKLSEPKPHLSGEVDFARRRAPQRVDPVTTCKKTTQVEVHSKPGSLLERGRSYKMEENSSTMLTSTSGEMMKGRVVQECAKLAFKRLPGEQCSNLQENLSKRPYEPFALESDMFSTTHSWHDNNASVQGSMEYRPGDLVRGCSRRPILTDRDSFEDRKVLSANQRSWLGAHCHKRGLPRLECDPVAEEPRMFFGSRLQNKQQDQLTPRHQASHTPKKMLHGGLDIDRQSHPLDGKDVGIRPVSAVNASAQIVISSQKSRVFVNISEPIVSAVEERACREDVIEIKDSGEEEKERREGSGVNTPPVVTQGDLQFRSLTKKQQTSFYQGRQKRGFFWQRKLVNPDLLTPDELATWEYVERVRKERMERRRKEEEMERNRNSLVTIGSEASFGSSHTPIQGGSTVLDREMLPLVHQHWDPRGSYMWDRSYGKDVGIGTVSGVNSSAQKVVSSRKSQRVFVDISEPSVSAVEERTSWEDVIEIKDSEEEERREESGVNTLPVDSQGGKRVQHLTRKQQTSFCQGLEKRGLLWQRKLVNQDLLTPDELATWEYVERMRKERLERKRRKKKEMERYWNSLVTVGDEATFGISYTRTHVGGLGKGVGIGTVAGVNSSAQKVISSPKGQRVFVDISEQSVSAVEERACREDVIEIKDSEEEEDEGREESRINTLSDFRQGSQQVQHFTGKQQTNFCQGLEKRGLLWQRKLVNPDLLTHDELATWEYVERARKERIERKEEEEMERNRYPLVNVGGEASSGSSRTWIQGGGFVPDRELRPLVHQHGDSGGISVWDRIDGKDVGIRTVSGLNSSGQKSISSPKSQRVFVDISEQSVSAVEERASWEDVIEIKDSEEEEEQREGSGVNTPPFVTQGDLQFQHLTRKQQTSFCQGLEGRGVLCQRKLVNPELLTPDELATWEYVERVRKARIENRCKKRLEKRRKRKEERSEGGISEKKTAKQKRVKRKKAAKRKALRAAKLQRYKVA